MSCCEKKHDRDRIAQALREIREGISNICEGLRDLGQSREALRRAIHEIAEALKLAHQAERELKEGEQDICEGLGDIEKGLEILVSELGSLR